MKEESVAQELVEIAKLLTARGWVVHPQNIIRRALLNGLIDIEEATSSKVERAAKEVAEELRDTWPEGAGFGSSDMTAVIRDMLEYAGIKTKRRGNKLVRAKELTAAGDIDLGPLLQKAYRQAVMKLASDLKKVKGVETVKNDERARSSGFVYSVQLEGYTRGDLGATFAVVLAFSVKGTSDIVAWGMRPDWGKSSTTLVNESFGDVIPATKIMRACEQTFG